MISNLKGKASKALAWSFADRVGQQGVQFLVSIVLARLLMPSEIGLIGLLAIFLAIAESFIESGFRQALIQKGETTLLEESSVFYLNIMIGCLALALMWIAAPFIADFFRTPDLLDIARVLSFNLLFNSFGLIQTAILTKKLDFRTQVKAGLTASVISGAIGIGMAYQGFGVWSLVAQSIALNIIRNGLLWRLNSWRPAMLFSWAALGGMFGFGSRLLISGIIDTFFRQIYNPIIGRLFLPTELGYYTIATRITQLPTESLTSIFSRVMFPIFSAVRSDRKQLKRSINKSLRLMMFINIPILVGLALIAENLVLVVLTEKWLPAVPYIRLYCMVALLLPFHYTNLGGLLALGRSDLHLRLEIIKKILIIAFLSVAWHWGVTGLILSQVMLSLVSCYLNSYYIGKLVGYSMIQQVRDILPSLGMGILMGAVVSLLAYIDFHSAGDYLASQILVGVVSFISIGFLFRLSIIRELITIIQSIKSGELSPLK